MRTRRCDWLAVLVSVLWAGAVAAAEPKVTTLLEGLENPCGVALQPETNVLFVADSGAGRIVRLGAEGQAVDAVTGFPLDSYGDGPTYRIGPLGLVFLDKKTLVVGDGGKPPGEDLLRIYKLPDDGSAVVAEQMKASFSLPGEGEIKPEGNFFGVAAAKNAIFVTCHGDEAKGWIGRCEVKGEEFGPLQRFVATTEAVQLDTPLALAVDKSGNLVVGQAGGPSAALDSLLTFYNARTGVLLARFPTGLHDISALAYHPQKARLYALDFAWANPTQGGLFTINRAVEDGKPVAQSTKVMSLMKPTAMTFAPDGVLYATVFGEAGDGTGTKTGKLLKIEL